MKRMKKTKKNFFFYIKTCQIFNKKKSLFFKITKFADLIISLKKNYLEKIKKPEKKK